MCKSRSLVNPGGGFSPGKPRGLALVLYIAILKFVRCLRAFGQFETIQRRLCVPTQNAPERG